MGVSNPIITTERKTKETVLRGRIQGKRNKLELGRGLGAGIVVLLDNVGSLLANHDGGNVGVAAWKLRND